MRCAKARTMINLEMDGALPPEQTPALETHLSQCAECRSHREELELGRRLLHATSAEPSDAFEWKLQLRLNQALQEAAGANVPWEEESRTNWFGWLRTFSLSSAAGLALSLLVAAWLLPGDTVDSVTSGAVGLVAQQETGRSAEGAFGVALTDESAVTASAGNRDRLPLASNATPAALTRSGVAGRVVNVGAPGFFSDEPTWLNLEGVQGRNLSVLRDEVRRLRARLMQSEKENEELKALLNDGGLGYLDHDTEGQSE